MIRLSKKARAGDGVGEMSQGARSAPTSATTVPIEIPAGDPLETVLLSHGGPLAVADLELDSAVLDQIRANGVDLIVPLIGQGELLGTLYLGPRLSDQPYSTDDRHLLGNLASQVAPAIKVAQLVREQQAEAKERERIDQELRVAALIQQTLLPKRLPVIPGWHVDAFYRPARAVGGDFYDFIELDDGRLGVVIGDVTDKGVPAALVMATSRSMLRAAAHKHGSPWAVLAEVNDALVAEIPPAMFVTCLYAIIDTEAGEVVLANAGHNLPYVRTSDGVVEVRATGMPLGLMPGMAYEERSYQLEPGDLMVLTSDGITEAHNPEGEMYGFPRLMGQVGSRLPDDDTVGSLVADLERFTGAEAEQEDDITLVAVRRTMSAQSSAAVFDGDDHQRVVATFSVPSEEGNERLAIEKVVAAIAPFGLDSARLERLKTAVGETVMNAMEHGNGFRREVPVDISIVATAAAVRVQVTDQGGDREIPTAEVPDLEAKLTGEQTARGWGLFLIEQMVDELVSHSANGSHTVELVMTREGGS